MDAPKAPWRGAGWGDWVGSKEKGPGTIEKKPQKSNELIWANYNDVFRRLVTLNGGLIRELPQNPRKIQV